MRTPPCSHGAYTGDRCASFLRAYTECRQMITFSGIPTSPQYCDAQHMPPVPAPMSRVFGRGALNPRELRWGEGRGERVDVGTYSSTALTVFGSELTGSFRNLCTTGPC